MSTKMMRRLKKGTYVDQHKFEGPGVDFKSKLIGIADVSSPRGDETCRDALSELKATALKNQKEKKEHKQKITLNITLKGIRLIDELTERIDHAHPIHRISFISHDDNDKRTFGYIVGTKDGYKLFAIKTVKEAKQITATLKELFQEVFNRCQSKQDEEGTENAYEEPEEKKSEDETKVDGPIEVAEEATEATGEEIDDSALVWELNDQIKEMQNVGIPHSESFDMIDPFTNGKEVSGEPSSHRDTFDDDFVPTHAKSNPALIDEFGSDPFGEKIDFIALPTADEIRKNIKNSTDSGSSSTDIMNNSKSDDLFALDPVPHANDTSKFSDDLFALYNPASSCNGTSTVSEEPLMKHDPFDEMKKTINQLHKQNLIQQQQQQQRGYQSTFAPHRIQQNTAPFNTTNPYVQNAPHSFMGTSNSLPPPIPVRPTPVVPARPGVGTNPFLSQRASNQTEVEPSMGWTVLNTSPTPKEVIKPNTVKLDPFSFLDDTPSLMANSMSISNSTSNHVNGNKEILDLLG